MKKVEIVNRPKTESGEPVDSQVFVEKINEKINYLEERLLVVTKIIPINEDEVMLIYDKRFL